MDNLNTQNQGARDDTQTC